MSVEHGHTLEDWQELAHCTTCGGAEGSLPTQCPGERMPGPVADRVYAGALDFIDGRWVQMQRTGLVLRLRAWGCPGAPLTACDRWGDTHLQLAQRQQDSGTREDTSCA